jgi:hypothetical protein
MLPRVTGREVYRRSVAKYERAHLQFETNFHEVALRDELDKSGTTARALATGPSCNGMARALRTLGAASVIGPEFGNLLLHGFYEVRAFSLVAHL